MDRKAQQTNWATSMVCYRIKHSQAIQAIQAGYFRTNKDNQRMHHYVNP